MREIKFRGYSSEELISESQWLEGYGVTTIEYADNTETTHLFTPYGDYRVEKDSIGQYTGRKDKSGKEIYEGDIFKNCEGLIKLVVWKDNGFKAKYTFKRRYQGEEWSEHSFTDLGDTESRRWGVEIIGNIYENKEILEK